MICCVCQRERESFKTLTLSVQERSLITKATGKEAPESISYCKACWQVSVDKVQGPQLFKGMLQLQLRAAGVRNSEQITEGIQARMVKRAAKPVS